jgi:hypothetical protein
MCLQPFVQLLQQPHLIYGIQAYQKFSGDKKYLQVWCKRIRKAHISGKSAEDKIAHLDARGWNDITETEVMVTQKLWKVM